jgi:hypothetical protein
MICSVTDLRDRTGDRTNMGLLGVAYGYACSLTDLLAGLNLCGLGVLRAQSGLTFEVAVQMLPAP